MYNSVETISEFEQSTRELFIYIQSSTVSKSCTNENDTYSQGSSTSNKKDYLSLTERDKIVEFIQTSVLSNKHMFAKCYYMDIRSYEENTTNPVEQQNSSTKTGFASTKPNQSLESSAKKLTKKSQSVNESKKILL